ncbi:MAG: beta-lactamase family protein, partial [Kordiimonadaceae bacterium]|nr:beta-lactamase family protein [Kordiimonadaceae bacterium]
NKTALLSMLIFYTFVGYANSQTLDEYIKLQMDERKIPGIQLAVIKDGIVVKMESYGTANIQDSIATTNDTIFPLNSITKAFVGVAAMQLVEQGKIDLSASPAKYLPGLPNAWKDTTIFQLFTHISGLPEIMRGDATLITVGGQDVAWDLVKTLPTQFEPGEDFSYNQTGYAIIGKIIEKVSGQPFVEFITEHQLQKVGMPKTIQAGFTHLEGIVPNQARMYTYYFGNKLTSVTNEVFPPILRAAAGMSSNTTEIAKWLNALNNWIY